MGKKYLISSILINIFLILSIFVGPYVLVFLTMVSESLSYAPSNFVLRLFFAAAYAWPLIPLIIAVIYGATHFAGVADETQKKFFRYGTMVNLLVGLIYIVLLVFITWTLSSLKGNRPSIF